MYSSGMLDARQARDPRDVRVRDRLAEVHALAPPWSRSRGRRVVLSIGIDVILNSPSRSPHWSAISTAENVTASTPEA